MRKTIKLFSLMASIALSGAVTPVLADTAPAASPTAAPTPVVAVNGLVDTYYTYNFTNSSNSAVGTKGNVGTFFNTVDDAFQLGLGEVDVNVSLGNTSGHLSLVTGDASYYLFGGTTTPAPASYTVNALQAYVSYAPDQWTFNLGRWMTWMGNEVIQSKANMNYSRSLLFWYTIPLWHQGLSVGYLTSDSKFGVTGYITNGWNNAGVPISSLTGGDLGKTYGLQLKAVPDSTLTVILNGIIGPNNGGAPASIGGMLTNIDPSATKWVGEAIVSFVPNSTWSFALDAEYGSLSTGNAGTAANAVTLNDGTTTATSLTFWGVDLYGRYQVASDWALALRLEMLEDTDDSVLGLSPIVPTSGKPANDVSAKEATLTVEHNFSSNLLMRLEGRMDMAASGSTQYDSATAVNAVGPFAGGGGTQVTGTASAVFSF